MREYRDDGANLRSATLAIVLAERAGSRIFGLVTEDIGAPAARSQFALNKTGTPKLDLGRGLSHRGLKEL
jgi:hypothetical protein